MFWVGVTVMEEFCWPLDSQFHVPPLIVDVAFKVACSPEQTVVLVTVTKGIGFTVTVKEAGKLGQLFTV